MAIKTLCELRKSRKPVNGIFNLLVTEYPLTEKDRQLATTITYGVLRNREALDLLLQTLCTQPLNKIKPFIRQALRCGLFQIFFMDRIPKSAAVNESVKAVQMAHLPKRLHGFVNGVLRNAIRKEDELQNLLTNPPHPILNHPQWLTQKWQKRYGSQENQRICQQNNEQALFSIQINSCVSTRDTLSALLAKQNIASHCGHWCKDCLIVETFQGGVTSLPGFQEGHFQVQDQGAQLLPALLGEFVQDGHYLDACAGLGGKTSVLLQMAQNSGAVVSAVEPDRMRRQKFRENMQRLHPAMEVALFSGTLQEYAVDSGNKFNGILLDAPCSGTGVIRRHPDIRWNRVEDDFSRYQKTQLELLDSAAQLLLPGGILVYATCSLEWEENEEVVALFLQVHPNFVVDDCATILPNSAHPLLVNGNFAPLPDLEIDGFFGVRLRKAD